MAGTSAMTLDGADWPEKYRSSSWMRSGEVSAPEASTSSINPDRTRTRSSGSM